VGDADDHSSAEPLRAQARAEYKFELSAETLRTAAASLVTALVELILAVKSILPCFGERGPDTRGD
jgi:hypothetical protein